MTNAVFTAAGAGAFSAAGNQTVLAATGSGATAWVGLPVGPTNAAMAGNGDAEWVGSSTGAAVLAATGLGSLIGTAVGVPPAVLTATGFGDLEGVAQYRVGAVATMAGAGVFAAAGSIKPTIGTMTGAGAFKGRAAYSNLLPFNYPPSWSIMIYGATVEGAGYDPISRNLKVWFTNTFGQFIILQNMPYNVTTAIQYAPNPEAYVLRLIAAS